jgi:hypothetical protein
MTKDLRRLADTETAEPVCSRVCDHAVMALLILHQVDIEQVFRQYGFRNFTKDGFQEENNAMFDKVIADLPEIRKKYFTDPPARK